VNDTDFLTRKALGLAILVMAAATAHAQAPPQPDAIPIGIIDFYGLKHVKATQARAALVFAEGTLVSPASEERPAFLAATEQQLAALPGVARATTTLVCCDSGRIIVYIGVEERGVPSLHFDPAPHGAARLADDIAAAGREFDEALERAVERGDAGEDDAQGHALAHDAAVRAVQERFIALAGRDGAMLREVLRTSADEHQRALAAQVLAYTTDKRSVVADLAHAIRDPSPGVRNNAMRALMVFAQADAATRRDIGPIPAAPFVGFLRSPVWSDRNKALAALLALSAGNPALLGRLRRDAVRPVVEMARWQSRGHALPAVMLLGRIAGYKDAEIARRFDAGDRESIIAAALHVTSAHQP